MPKARQEAVANDGRPKRPSAAYAFYAFYGATWIGQTTGTTTAALQPCCCFSAMNGRGAVLRAAAVQLNARWTAGAPSRAAMKLCPLGEDQHRCPRMRRVSAEVAPVPELAARLGAI
jgi:hypothetical protein